MAAGGNLWPESPNSVEKTCAQCTWVLYLKNLFIFPQNCYTTTYRDKEAAMGKYTFAMILFWIQDIVIRAHKGQHWPRLHGGIRFLESGTCLLDPACLYIGTPALVREAIQNHRVPQKGACILVSGRDASGPDDPLTGLLVPPQLFLIETGSSLFSLTSKYTNALEHTHSFQESFSLAFYLSQLDIRFSLKQFSLHFKKVFRKNSNFKLLPKISL